MKLLLGDCLERLKELPSESVQTCVTSPPYFGLRDYGKEGQIGLEDSPFEFITKLVLVFEEVRRVLKKDGTLWLNLGDSYAGSGRGLQTKELSKKQKSNKGSLHLQSALEQKGKIGRKWIAPHAGFKRKELIGIPWRVAFALQSDGWYLRQDIIWHKPNPMPESVKDRCTKAHEYIFLLSKSPKYYFNSRAIKEPCLSMDPESKSFRPNSAKMGFKGERKVFSGKHEKSFRSYSVDGKNKRSVWTVTTKPFKGAHFATFPMDLIEPCVLAGSAKGDIVLDPFMGSGTVGIASKIHGREFIGIELNETYLAIAKKRINQEVGPGKKPMPKTKRELQDQCLFEWAGVEK